MCVGGAAVASATAPSSKPLSASSVFGYSNGSLSTPEISEGSLLPAGPLLPAVTFHTTEANLRDSDPAFSLNLKSPSPLEALGEDGQYKASLPSPKELLPQKNLDLLESKYGPHEVQTRKEKLIICLFISLWFLTSISSLFMAKYILHTYKVNEGLYTLWLLTCSCVFGVLFTQVFRLHNLTKLSRQQIKAVIPLSAAFLVKEFLKYASIARVSVNLVNTIRSSGPLFSVILEFIFLNHRPPLNVVWSLSPIIVGVALTSIDEINATTSNGILFSTALVGVTCAVVSTGINIGQNIYSKLLFGRKKIDPVSLQIYLSAISLVLMSPYNLVSYIAHWRWEDENKGHFLAPNIEVALCLLLAGFINFLASQLAFNTLNRITPLSYSVANTAKRVAIACIAIFVFREYVSSVNGLGIFISIVGVFIYERAARGYKEALLYRKLEGAPRVHKRSGSEVVEF